MPTIDLGEARRLTSEAEQKYGLPAGTLFKQTGIESNFDATAVSRKGAAGYLQWMPATAKSYNVKIGDYASEVDGAGRYMRDNLVKYNGNLDLALADYNGGPKAAMALAKGKPWSETSGYLAKFHGDGNYTAPSKQFTTSSSAPLSVSPSASELSRDADQQRAEYGGMWNNIANLPSAVATGFKIDNSVYNFFQDRGLSSTDPNFRWTDENTKHYLNGVPERHWDYILQSKSDQEAQLRRGRMMDSLEKEQQLARMGVAGVGGRLVGSLVDLPTLIAFVPGLGGEGLLSTTSRLANAARMGVFNAGFNVAADAVAGQYKPTFTTDSLYLSAAMGLGLGAAVGGALNPAKIAASRLAAEQAALAKFGQREATAAQRSELIDLAGGEHAINRQHLDEHLPNTNVDSKVATGGAEPVVDPTVQKIRDEVIARDQQLRDRMDQLVSGEGAAQRSSRQSELAQKLHDEQAARDAQAAKDAQTGSKAGDIAPDQGKATGGNIPEYEFTNMGRKAVKGYGDQSTKKMISDLKGSKDDLIAGLASRLESQIAGMDDIKIVTRGPKHRSYYDPVNHEIHLAKGADDWVKLHEIAHAVTANKIRYGRQNPNTVHGQLTKELEQVYQEVKQASYSQRFTHPHTKYYLKNIDEFVAGIFSGRQSATEFLNFLKSVKVADDSGHSFLSKAVDIIRKLLGMDSQETNALTKALGITDKLIDTPLNVKATWIQPKTFTRTKVEYRMEPLHSPVDEATVEAANRAEIPTVFGWGLGLENRLGGGKSPSAVRDLASKLFGTTIGYKDHSVVKANAWDDTTKWAESWAVEMRKGTYPQFEKWFSQQGRKWHEKGQAFEEFGSQVSNYIRGFEGDFPPEVVKAGDQMRATLNKAREYINNPLLDEGMVKRGLTETEIRDPKTGEVKIVGTLERNDNYLPRKHDINKWNDMAVAFGREAVEGWWARAYQSGREGISDEAAAKWAKWYVRTVEEAHANRSQDLLEDLMRGTDKEGLKHSLMVNGGYTEHEAQNIIAEMFPTKESGAGRMASLKHRNTINETYTESWTRSDGSKVDVSLNDFIHTNAFDVVEPYLRRTAGSVSLAKHLDIYKANQIDNTILDATTNHLGEEFKHPSELAKFRKDLKFAFDRIQGIPQEEFTTLNKSLEMWRNFNIIRLMGGAVWNQATELSQIVGSMGWKTTLAAVPELRALRRDIQTGKAPNDILDHLENTIGGVGSEYVARMEFGLKDDWVRNKGDTKFNRVLDKVDTAQSKLAKGVLDYTGMTPMMIQQKRVHAVALVNHFVHTANGKPSTFLTKDRLAWMGMSEGDYAKVLENIKKFTTPTKGEYGASFKMDFNGWTKEDPRSYSQFMTAIHRESRRVVQENDLGSMIPLMGSTLGKTVFQFMNFSMHGWNKSLQFAMNHRDWSTLSTVLHGSLFASLAYMGRTMMSAQGMDETKKREFLDKRMSSSQIVLNSFGRISQASLLPVAFDTVSPMPLFQGMRTTSDLSSMASNPTYQALNGLISMKKLIRNGASDQYQTTEKDVRTWGKLLPLNNVYPISTFINSLASDYPRNEKQD